MTLEEWAAANEKLDADLAVHLGVDRTTISRIRRGKLMPSGSLIQAIWRLTHGAVTPDTFRNDAA